VSENGSMRYLPNPTEQPTVTVDEAAAVLGIGRNAAYAATRTGELPSIRIGRRTLIPTAELRRLLRVDTASAGQP
jgi:excisionase family DNA binding protein